LYSAFVVLFSFVAHPAGRSDGRRTLVLLKICEAETNHPLNNLAFIKKALKFQTLQRLF
jgi:hypothetical protein